MPHQLEASRIARESDIFFVICGTGWGKTYWLIGHLLMMCCDEGSKWNAENRKKNKDGELTEPYLVILVAPTNKMLRLIHIPIMDMCTPGLIQNFEKTDLKYTLENGSQMILLSAENPDRIRGLRPNGGGLDEMREYDKYVYTVLYNRVAFRKGWIIGATTPSGFDWTHDIEEASVDDPKINVISGRPSTENPLFDPKRIELDAGRMDERFHKQEYFAERISKQGGVYNITSENIRPCEFVANLPIWFAMDFNVNPMTCAVLQRHGQEVWCVDEIQLMTSNTWEICDEIDSRYNKYFDLGPRARRSISNIAFYPDPSGIAKQHGGMSNFEIIRQHFRDKYQKEVELCFRRKAPYVMDRINAVNAMLKNAKGERRFFIDPKCKNVIRSFERTVFKEGTNQVDKTKGTEHFADGVGYAIELEFPIQQISVGVI